MNTKKELEKIDQIFRDEKFIFKGKVFDLDVEATNAHPLNANLHGKPLKKLVGSHDSTTLTVWSHDVYNNPEVMDVVVDRETQEMFSAATTDIREHIKKPAKKKKWSSLIYLP